MYQQFDQTYSLSFTKFYHPHTHYWLKFDQQLLTYRVQPTQQILVKAINLIIHCISSFTYILLLDISLIFFCSFVKCLIIILYFEQVVDHIIVQKFLQFPLILINITCWYYIFFITVLIQLSFSFVLRFIIL